VEGISLITKPFFFEFVAEHEADDPARLVLEAHRYPAIPVREAAQQISARQKAKLKLPTWYAQREVLFPSPLSLEQCSSETAARFKASLLQGHSLIDLTGGLGVDTYFLAQSFAQVDYVERQAVLCALARHNFGVLGASQIAVHEVEALAFLQAGPVADAVYLDPARRDAAQRKVFRLADCEPSLAQLWPWLSAVAPVILLKTSPLLDIEAALGELNALAPGAVQQVVVLAVNGEVKEVLYKLRTADQPSLTQPPIRAVNLTKAGPEELAFVRANEARAIAPLALPGRFIYEPNAAILKAGAFKTVAERFGLRKLHPHTHLYTADQLVPNFPGRVFALAGTSKMTRKDLHNWLPEGKANLTVRNFPLGVAEIRQKLNLHEGGDVYLFATTLMDQSRAILVCHKVGKDGKMENNA
jgi:THUMP domain-like